MIFNKYIIENNFFYYIKIILFVFFIFFFDLGIDNANIFGISYDFFDARVVLLIIIPIFFYEFIVLEKKYSNIFYFIIFSILILLHVLIINYIKNIDNTLINLLKIFISLTYISIIIFYKNFILKNILKLIEVFLIFYFVLINANVVLNYYDSEMLCFFGCFSQNREIFKEASHFAYTSPILIIYYLNIVPFYKINLKLKLLLLFYLTSILYNLSTTLLATIVITSLIILITNFKNLENKKILIFITIFFLSLIPFDKNTIKKINHFYNVNLEFVSLVAGEIPILGSIKEGLATNKISDRTEHAEHTENVAKNKKIKRRSVKNLSVEVLITNIKLSTYSIRKNIIGWGLHNYKNAHSTYISTVNTSPVKGTGWLNSSDGTNNFNKGLVEFGILFFIPILMILNLLFNKRFTINEKLLLFPILFSQTFIRGSGFFNGGYIVFLVILAGLYITKYKNINS